MNLNKLLWASTAIVALASCQTASDPYMTLETKSLSLEVDGGTATVKLFTNVYYRVNNDCTDDAGNYWARITDTEVDGDATTFHIKYDANEKSVVRTGTVRFIGDGVTPLKLTLNQKAVAPKGITPNFVELPFTENNTTFTVLDERVDRRVRGQGSRHLSCVRKGSDQCDSYPAGKQHHQRQEDQCQCRYQGRPDIYFRDRPEEVRRHSC